MQPSNSARDLRGAAAADIEPDAGARKRRRADDAGIDIARARGLDHAPHRARRLRRDRIGVDVDAAEAAGGDRARQLQRRMRRTDGEHDIGRLHRARQRFDVLEAAGLGAPARRGAAAGGGPQDAMSARDEAGADGGAHLARVQHGYGAHRRARLRASTICSASLTACTPARRQRPFPPCAAARRCPRCRTTSPRRRRVHIQRQMLQARRRRQRRLHLARQRASAAAFASATFSPRRPALVPARLDSSAPAAPGARRHRLRARSSRWRTPLAGLSPQAASVKASAAAAA